VKSTPFRIRRNIGSGESFDGLFPLQRVFRYKKVHGYIGAIAAEMAAVRPQWATNSCPRFCRAGGAPHLAVFSGANTRSERIAAVFCLVHLPAIVTIVINRTAPRPSRTSNDDYVD
jgi:hypothetical protein